MTNKKRVLVFPCGSEIGLEINRALANDIHFELIGASSLPDHGKFVYKNYIEGLPYITDKNFLPDLISICERYKIDFIVPAMDSVILELAKHIDKIPATIIMSPAETCELACSKGKTYEKLKGVINCPKTYSINDNIDFPVFIKPDFGYGSVGAKKVNSKEELVAEYNKNHNIIISEFLPAEEYTIDCFTDRNGKLLFAGGRQRARVKSGISVNSYPVNNPEFQTIAEKINSAIKFRGMWFFQLKKNKNGDFTLLEIAPRIAGTMGMYRGLGINFIQLALYDAMEYDVNVIKNDFNIEIDRALFARFKHNIQYDTVYMDFDDTILFGDNINTDAMKFLYQAKNENKKVILITKHIYDIKETLAKYCISESLFDEIIHLRKEDEKSNYIKHKNAIFIDDSFAERKKIIENCKIPVFGIDAIETLFDYRR